MSEVKLLGKPTLELGWKALVRLTTDAFEIEAEGLGNGPGHGCAVLGDDNVAAEAWLHNDGKWRDRIPPSSTTLGLAKQLYRIKSDGTGE